MESWSTLIKTRVKPWIFQPLDTSETLGELELRDIQADKEYLHVRLLAMRLPFARKWSSTYHGSLNSYVRLEHQGGPPAEFLLTTSPAKLRSIGDADATRVALGPTRLAGPVPYRGGDLEIQVGLFAIKAKDLAEPYLDFLQSVGHLSGVSFIDTARSLVQPLQKALNGLLGNTETVLEAGASRTFTPPRTGVFAVLATNAKEASLSKFQLVGDTLYRKDDKPVDDIAYVVFSVETSTTRADWPQLPGLGEAYSDLKAAVLQDNYPEVNRRLGRFRRTAILSPDLITADAATIVTKVEQLIQLALPSSGQSIGERSLPNFAELAIFPRANEEPANLDLVR